MIYAIASRLMNIKNRSVGIGRIAVVDMLSMLVKTCDDTRGGAFWSGTVKSSTPAPPPETTTPAPNRTKTPPPPPTTPAPGTKTPKTKTSPPPPAPGTKTPKTKTPKISKTKTPKTKSEKNPVPDDDVTTLEYSEFVSIPIVNTDIVAAPVIDCAYGATEIPEDVTMTVEEDEDAAWYAMMREGEEDAEEDPAVATSSELEFDEDYDSGIDGGVDADIESGTMDLSDIDIPQQPLLKDVLTTLTTFRRKDKKPAPFVNALDFDDEFIP